MGLPLGVLAAVLAASQQSGATPAALFDSGQDGFWLDLADGSQRWTTSAGTTLSTTAGDRIGLVGDKSGNGNSFSQATAADRPELVSSDGNFWMLTNGTSTVLEGPTLATVNPSSAAYEAWAVVQFLTVDTNSASPWLNDSVLADVAGWAAIFYARTSGVIGVGGGSGGAQTVTVAADIAEKHVVHARLQGGTLFVSVDGGAESSATCADFGSKGSPLLIGRGFAGFSNLRVGELVFRDGSVDSSLRSEITQHLKSKWSIA